jgi:hypothetical protein
MGSAIIIPPYENAYSGQVAKLESGKTDIDFRLFRESFLQSEQWKTAMKQSTVLLNLKRSMREAKAASEHLTVMSLAKQILSIDYTDLFAQKALRQAYKLAGDDANEKKYHDIEFGLFRSIMKSGDGRACKTAWSVVQVSEEYFILNVVLDGKIKRQSIDRKGGICDKMEVETERGPETFYFDISTVFAGYDRLGIN